MICVIILTIRGTARDRRRESSALPVNLLREPLDVHTGGASFHEPGH